jgi:hypothetical protein
VTKPPGPTVRLPVVNVPPNCSVTPVPCRRVILPEAASLIIVIAVPTGQGEEVLSGTVMLIALVVVL